MDISIDIGTSYSSLCIQNKEGKPDLVKISTGMSIYGNDFALPTAVFVEEDGEEIIGQAAMNSRKKKPQNFRSEFKRNIGEEIPIILGNRSFLPEDLYTELFRHMKNCAEKAGNEQIEKTYITYPASFSSVKKERIEKAAKAAGLFTIEMIDEPTAAGLDFCNKQSLHEGDKLLIYDFGGGTFDAALIQYQNGGFN